jgi:succinate-semialdehyde dehydrogenase/glutarate-semialdehyde dehydrogenase
MSEVKRFLKDPSLIRECGLINGEWSKAQSGKVFEVINPASGKILSQVPDMAAQDTEMAIEAAHAAGAAWRAKLPAARAALLRKWYDLIVEHSDDLAAIMTLEQGKPLPQAKAEVLSGARFVEWFAEEAKRVLGDVVPPQQPGRRVFVTKEPVGVVAAITPWNFPSSMVTRKVSPALAAGCTIVLKPAEDTPLSALALADLACRAGIEPGVFNVVTAKKGADIGAAITSSALVRKVSFTGSTRVGKLIARQCTDSVKNVSLELGGNAPFVVFEDADLDKAVQCAVQSKFFNSGQTCICPNRFLVQEGVYETFLQRYVEAVRGSVKVGSGMDPQTTAGPLINAGALEKIRWIVDDATGLGARLLTGGELSQDDSLMFQPTVLADITPAMACVDEEIFGPVASIMSFKDEEEAIDLANRTPYGLAAYCFTGDMERIWRLSDALEAGMVNINEGLFTSEAMPFGGIKESGIGREGSHYGIDEFLELKTVTLGSLAS